MYIVKQISNTFFPRTVATVETLPEAIRNIRGKIYQIEEDEHFPDHYDIITWQGEQFAIEPRKVKTNA